MERNANVGRRGFFYYEKIHICHPYIFKKVLGLKLDFKDCARRVAFTKLANDPRISDEDAAKYMHVNKKTLSTYHQTDDEAKWRAADILSKPMYKPKVCYRIMGMYKICNFLLKKILGSAPSSLKEDIWQPEKRNGITEEG